ncbi:MAG: methyltransferase domain-containing protein [Deltaproteobacteria bacterium]|nr:methyltransferase domain-containing protein [Deltaproteobacteria bacterium]
MNTEFSHELPEWKAITNVKENTDWQWCRSRLLHRSAGVQTTSKSSTNPLRAILLSHFYADHNRRGDVPQLVQDALKEMSPGDWGLNYGSGRNRLHPRVINVDVVNIEGVDIVNDGKVIPFSEDSIRVAISQEVFEHVDDPVSVEREIYRVLVPGGLFYCQVPFIIGYHPGPTDYWRFTKEGIRRLFPQDRWEIERLSFTVGHGTAAYRILVEYFAVTASVLGDAMYLPVKGAAAVLLSPLKLTDGLSKYASQRDRIPGGYYILARKRERVLR